MADIETQAKLPITITNKAGDGTERQREEQVKSRAERK